MKTIEIATCVVGNIKQSLCKKGDWKLGRTLPYNHLSIPKCMRDCTQQLRKEQTLINVLENTCMQKPSPC
jgi:hypothetical protein